MKVLRTLVLPAVFSLALFAGCNPENPVLPDPPGAEGYCDMGWEAYGAGNFDQAMEYFQAAIDVDVTYPGGYLGAGWTAINLSDYWVIADNYFYMALQQDVGFAPLAVMAADVVQDTMWTVFECLDTNLPPAVLDPILELTADSGAIWVGEEIYALVSPDGQPDIPYRYHMDAYPAAMFYGINQFSQRQCDVDSIVPDGTGGYWVYLWGDYANVAVGDEDQRTWISVGNSISMDYVQYTPGTMSQDSYDALAGWAMLQHARGANGDPLIACGAVYALAQEVTGYEFGAGQTRATLVDIDINDVQLRGVAAANAYLDESFIFSWFTCKTAGYGLDLNKFAPAFEFELLQVIEDMLEFEG